jgi:hypothetical protein
LTLGWIKWKIATLCNQQADASLHALYRATLRRVSAGNLFILKSTRIVSHDILRRRLPDAPAHVRTDLHPGPDAIFASRTLTERYQQKNVQSIRR